MKKRLGYMPNIKLEKTNDFQLTYITDEPSVAKTAANSGVNRIMIDLELNGKIERQGHLNTVISHHEPQAINDIAKVLADINKGEVLVRLNPIHENSAYEISDAISRGAQRLMLPMFKNSREVKQFLDLVNKRVPVTLLLETQKAYQDIDSILRINENFEIHIGLNDLHLDMKLDFMFELFTRGIVDDIAKKCKAANCILGIGGIAPLSTKSKLSPFEIISYHLAVGSSSVILSRAWEEYMNNPKKCLMEVTKLRNYILQKPKLNRASLTEGVNAVVKTLGK